MARPDKLARYASNFESDNAIESQKTTYGMVKGAWSSNFFRNQNPIVLELACGKGEYTVGLAEKFPNKNYVGVDLKGDRIFIGSQQANERGLSNVAFVKSRMEFATRGFSSNEVNEIWLTFPDPRPKDRDEKHRLTNVAYLNFYRSILTPEGWFKVSDMKFTHDLYNSDLLEDHHGLQTKYEKI